MPLCAVCFSSLLMHTGKTKQRILVFIFNFLATVVIIIINKATVERKYLLIRCHYIVILSSQGGLKRNFNALPVRERRFHCALTISSLKSFIPWCSDATSSM